MRLILLLVTLVVFRGAPEVWADENTQTPHRSDQPVALTPNLDLQELQCQAGRISIRTLLRDKHHVDAHLLAQTMSILCIGGSRDWELMDAIALTHLDEYQRAHAMFTSLAFGASPLASRAKILSVWTLVKGGFEVEVPANQLSKQNAARIHILARIINSDSLGSQVALLSDGLRRTVVESYAKIDASRSKRPWLAGLMSGILPGAGQAYAGSWQGAGVAFLLNGLFFSATVELARRDLYFAAATTGTAASIFYVGNILNATDLARRYNQGASAEKLESLERILVPEAFY